MKILGIDEAGRGPLFGPLIMCGAVIDENKTEILRNLKVKDSKQLKPKERERLAEILPHYLQYQLIEVSPQEIDSAVFSEITNLNWLEADKTIELINYFKPDKVILDCPSRNIPAYVAYIKIRIDCSSEILAEYKADVNYPIVSAASILAKVKRDSLISDLKIKYGIDIGSGYPSDPKTKFFLQNYWNKYPEIFRQSWAPYKKYATRVVSKEI